MVATSTQPNTAIATGLMWATYLVAAIGFFMYFLYIASGETIQASRWLAAFTLGAVGVLSFLRHSVFHKADAARMNWTSAERNNFQIEVGLANLGWGVAGLLAVFLAWTPQTIGAITLVFGIYMAGAALIHIGDSGRRASLIASACFAVVLLFAAVQLLVIS